MENEVILNLTNKKLKLECKIYKEKIKTLNNYIEDLIEDNIVFVTALELVCNDFSSCKNLIADNVIRSKYSHTSEDFYIDKAQTKICNSCIKEAIKLKNIIKEFKLGKF